MFERAARLRDASSFRFLRRWGAAHRGRTSTAILRKTAGFAQDREKKGTRRKEAKRYFLAKLSLNRTRKFVKLRPNCRSASRFVGVCVERLARRAKTTEFWEGISNDEVLFSRCNKNKGVRERRFEGDAVSRRANRRVGGTCLRRLRRTQTIRDQRSDPYQRAAAAGRRDLPAPVRIARRARRKRTFASRVGRRSGERERSDVANPGASRGERRVFPGARRGASSAPNDRRPSTSSNDFGDRRSARASDDRAAKRRRRARDRRSGRNASRLRPDSGYVDASRRRENANGERRSNRAKRRRRRENARRSTRTQRRSRRAGRRVDRAGSERRKRRLFRFCRFAVE